VAGAKRVQCDYSTKSTGHERIRKSNRRPDGVLPPFTLDIERIGFVDAAKELEEGVVAYCPLARRMVSGKYRSLTDPPPTNARLRLPRFSPTNFPENLILADAITSIDADHGCAQVALARTPIMHPE